MRKATGILLPLVLILSLFAGCSGKIDKSNQTTDAAPTSTQSANASPTPEPAATAAPTPAEETSPSPSPPAASTEDGQDEAIPVAADPDSITVLVNKHFRLPDDFVPQDLVYPDVPFIFKEKLEKRKMRKVAADALVQLFAGAKEDGIYLAGVSGYRSAATQKAVFDNYVNQDGYEKARTYSALPGTSEHETGLAIDVSGSDGKCAASDCFAGSKEADWLAKHASEYGFIIRYPKGKESITGYEYEPWHIRYVGDDVAKEIAANNETLEEYLNAVPVSDDSPKTP